VSAGNERVRIPPVAAVLLLQHRVDRGKHVRVSHRPKLGEQRCTKSLHVTQDALAPLRLAVPQGRQLNGKLPVRAGCHALPVGQHHLSAEQVVRRRAVRAD